MGLEAGVVFPELDEVVGTAEEREHVCVAHRAADSWHTPCPREWGPRLGELSKLSPRPPAQSGLSHAPWRGLLPRSPRLSVAPSVCPLVRPADGTEPLCGL